MVGSVIVSEIFSLDDAAEFIRLLVRGVRLEKSAEKMEHVVRVEYVGVVDVGTLCNLSEFFYRGSRARTNTTLVSPTGVVGPVVVSF